MNDSTETRENSVSEIDGALFLSMMKEGCARLYRNRSVVNDLNVFPIPDGDTGDNMYMTLSSACEYASGIASSCLGETCSSFATGALMGARGNSGVILSRIFSGVSKGLEGLQSADIRQFASALRCGVKESYDAVSNPVEGTILTVWREAVERLESASVEDFKSFMTLMVSEMKQSLERTPQLLDVLKEAGVVDSGGAGLVCIAEGMTDALDGMRTESSTLQSEPSKTADFSLFGPDSELVYGYCTEFLLRLQTSKVFNPESFDESVIRDYLNSAGESVVCFKEGTIVKVHVHTMKPGCILNHCQQWGEFLSLKIENMTLQHNETEKPDSEEECFARQRKRFGIVAVATGEGFVKAFREAGTDVVIEGGQTMNPSVRSFIDAFDKVNASTIFVFPNNSNIILTARQAASMYDKSDVVVIPSRNMGTGYVTVASLDFSGGDVDGITACANEMLESMRFAYVSKAVRDSAMDGFDTHCGDYVGIHGGKIVASGNKRESVLLELASKLGASDCEVVMVFNGADVNAEDKSLAISALQKSYPRTEFIVTEGSQPVYDYILILC